MTMSGNCDMRRDNVPEEQRMRDKSHLDETIKIEIN